MQTSAHGALPGMPHFLGADLAAGYWSMMDVIPLSNEITSYLANLFPAPPTPEPPQTEPPFTPIREVMPWLIPSPGEVLVVVGMPDVRMLTAAIALAAEENQVVAIDKLTYAGPSLHSLVAALSGVSSAEDRWGTDRLLGAAEVLRRAKIVQVSNGGSDDLLTRFPVEAGLIIVEAERFADGLAGIAREATRTGKAAVVPHDHIDDLPAGSWEVLRLRRAGSYASGHTHFAATFDGSGEEVRLAQGSVGRFL